MTAANTTATQEHSNTVEIADAGPARKKVRIVIPAQTVSEKLRDSLDTLSVEAALPGFRKGRAPRGLVERKFGSAVREEAKKQLIASAYTEAMEEHKLQVVGEPFSETLDDVKVEDGKPLEFEFEVEVMPDFEIPPLMGLEVKRPTIDVTDQMVDDELRKLRINEGRLEQRETPEPSDYLTGHGIMNGPGPEGSEKEHYNIKGAVVQVPPPEASGKGMILGVVVDDFADQLGLPKAGETATIRTRGPEQHEIEAVRNADLTISFTVDRIDRIIPAEIEEVLERYGLDSQETLREQIRLRLRQRVMIQQQAVMRQQVAQYLLERIDFDLPERLTAQQTARVLQRQRLELMYRGFEPDKIEERMAELRSASGQIAQRELKLFFILTKTADHFDIGVSEAEMNGRIAQMAMERNTRPEALRQELIRQNQISGIYQQIREHKTFDAILGTASIVDVPAEEFNRLAADAAASRTAESEEAPAKRKQKAGAQGAAETDETDQAADSASEAVAQNEQSEPADQAEPPEAGEKPKRSRKKKSE
jgi:trigger factor